MVALLFIIALGVFYIIYVYNSLQTIRTRIKAAIQEIGNQLKRQANLIPNLVKATKGYLKHEKSIFTQLTKAREAILSAIKSNDVKQIASSQEGLKKVLENLVVLAESNPQIKASPVVQKLMDELRDTADKVMYARRTLIDLSADFNQKLVTFPSNIIAKMFGFKPEKGLEVPTEGSHFKVSKEETKTPEVKLS